MQFLWVLIFLLSCATEYVSIDTRPRGAQVLKKDNGDFVTLGNTPVFVEEDEREKKQYHFSYEDKKGNYIITKKAFEKSQSCLKKWKDPFYHSVTKKKKTGKYDPLEEVLDAFQEECVPYIRQYLKNMKSSAATKQCRKFLLVLPRSWYRKVSHHIVDHWRENIFPKESKFCDSLVDIRKSNVELMFDRKDNFNSPEKPEDMSFKNWARLGYKFKATHIIFFPYQKEKGIYTVTPTVVDLHSWEKDKKPSFSPFKKEIKMSTGFKIGNFFATAFRLIPNVFSVKLKMDSAFHLESNIDEEAETERYSYRDLRVGFSAGSFRFPKKRWFGEFELGPRASFTTWGKENRFYVTELSLALRFFLHFPFGAALNVKAYGGGAHIRASNKNYGKSEKIWTWDGGLTLELYSIFARRWMYSVGATRVWIPENTISNGDLSLKGESHIFLRFGYFFPELRALAGEYFY